ncbi:Pleckstrin homology domain-containing family A member 7 [Acipenser ruthenus]|uniref:Pleckstrin homology domain-containing family A member 7 n=1 Tax=Acipenser ruthenus TaxID=7906 RepID=A0A662YZ60_ACIRT|nr:Pleckstrin homology domain-containing family A member 7 [Acipenser ruthenus]
MAAPLGRDTLPEHWSYGVCEDGRVFFVNDETHHTTWLHPRSGEPVNSGHMIRSDLPRGWEEGFTDEGASYFINAYQEPNTTFFLHAIFCRQHNKAQRLFLPTVACPFKSRRALLVIEPRDPWRLQRENEIVLQTGIMAAPLGRDTLPEHWSYGVCEDGRVFFVNDETHHTTWLHPRSGEPVNSGHMIRSEPLYTCIKIFPIAFATPCHNQRTVTFRHPITGQSSPENSDFILQEQPNSRMSKQQTNQRPSSMVSETSTAVTSSTVDAPPGSKGSKSSGKVHSFGKRDHAIKRNPNMPVVARGWLYKQDSSGMRLWKRKWFVLADYCLFYYKDSREETVLGSISLPSYVIAPVEPEDHISRKYAFKATHTGMRSYIYNKNSIIGSQAEHCGMRTYYFSADTQEDMNDWIRAMNQAALMQTHTAEREADKMEKQAVPQTNHVNTNKGYTQAEVPPKQEAALRPVGETLGFEKREEIRKESEDEERYGFRKDTFKDKIKVKSPATVVEVDSLFTEPVGSSRAQPVQRNGTLPSARQAEQNGNPVYKRGSSLPVSEQTLSRRTPTSQPQLSTENYQTLPKNSWQPPSSPPPESCNLPSDYKYTHDRVSHFRMSNEERKAHKEGTVWQLYEWQQRQQFKHGSPTAPIYTGAPDYVDSSALKVSLEAPRSISVPPSPSDIPPPGPPPKALSPRRPHTPAERVTVKPVGERSTADFPASGSPGRIRAQVSKSYFSASGNLPSDYKYAHDRVSHFRMSNEERKAHKEGTVWQLYEWQQRQQFKHGSPTAPIYTGAPDYVDSSALKVSLEAPRSISVPPSPSDIPPPGPPPKALSPRRPHTPAERVTVKPVGERSTADFPASGSPGRIRAQVSKTTHADRRSMPPMGYMTHTVSAPSLHGKTPEELTLLLIQLRRHQAKMASVRNDTLVHLQQHNGSIKSTLQVSGRDSFKDRSAKPVRIAESDVDAKLSRLCEQDKTLQDLEAKIRILKEDKDKLESVLDVSHRQMEQYKEQPAHAEKIACQQRLLQEDLVQIRAEISRISTEMENAWSEYGKLEMDVDQLGEVLQEQMNRTILSQLTTSLKQEKSQMQKDLWRIEDVMAGLSSSKANYKFTIDSVQNPERQIVPSMSSLSVPSLSMCVSELESRSFMQRSPQLSPSVETRLQPQKQLRPQPHMLQLQNLQPQSLFKPVPKLAEEEAPPRPPLPYIYSPDDQPPAVPPLPKEASVIRHTSVRGLKRQSDERKKDREFGQYVNGDYKVELRSYMSEPELINIGSDPSQLSIGASGPDSGYQTLPNRGLSGSTSRLNQSTNISSYVTLRRGGGRLCSIKATNFKSMLERPKSALERLYSGDQQKGRMSAEEQLERMKRHQKALVRERKRSLSQGEHLSISSRSSSRPLSADVGSWKREQEFDLQLLERALRGEDKGKEKSDDWLTVHAVPMKEADLEPQDYNLDISRELSKPDKVLIPERYVEMDPEEPLSLQEMEARHRKVERIKSILAKSSVQNMQPAVSLDAHDFTDLDSALQEQERIITMSYALASEASEKSKQAAAEQQVYEPNAPSPSVAQAPYPPLSNGFHYRFV